MVARRRGRILLTSSIVATMPGPYQSTYNASKSFVQSFGLALRDSSADEVSITVLMPGDRDAHLRPRRPARHAPRRASKDDPADVAEQAVDALLAGRERVVAASLPLRLANLAGGVLPDSLKARLNAVIARPVRSWASDPGLALPVPTATPPYRGDSAGQYSLRTDVSEANTARVPAAMELTEHSTRAEPWPVGSRYVDHRAGARSNGPSYRPLGHAPVARITTTRTPSETSVSRSLPILGSP